MLFFRENLVLVFLGVLALGRGIYIVKDECPPNEEYLICGSACPGNCSNLTAPDNCTEDCVEGCFCTVGLVRDENGTCVSPDQCGTTPACAQHQVYTSCGPSCPPACSQPDDQLCTLQCVQGCFCVPPYVLDDNGSCTTMENCLTPIEPCLNENEVYDSCSGGCEPTCSDPEPVCNKICMGGCICGPGLLRNDSGECVGVDKCPTNVTDVTLLAKYLNDINKILHL